MSCLPFDTLHALLSYHEAKLRGQPQHDFRLGSSVVQLRLSESCAGLSIYRQSHTYDVSLEFVLMRRRFDDRGLYVVIHDDSWEKLIQAATQLLSLPDDYYEKLVYCRVLPFHVQQLLLPLHPSRRQCVCRDAFFSNNEVSLLASLDAPIHIILHPGMFQNKKKQRNNGQVDNLQEQESDAGQQFVQCLAERTSPFGSLTIYENALSDTAWAQLLQLLNMETTTPMLIQTLELIELDIHDASLLSNARLETLSLSHCSLADDGESLQQALAEGRGPTRLVLDQVVGWEGRLHHSRKTVPFDAWTNLMLTFAKPTCLIQHLELGSSPYYDIGGFFLAFLEGLALNHSLISLVIRKYDGILSFWDDLADIVLHHKALRSIDLIYESTVCHDAARMFRPLSRLLDTNRNIVISYEGKNHNRTFERIIVPKLRINRFHNGTQTLGQVANDSVRAYLFAQALIGGCQATNDDTRLLSRQDYLLRLWWLFSRNTDILVTLLQR
ncbi:hypothetical protein FisN_32Hh073 [Fistulifera solaris]|uniref:Uncharacterized protein n=1 Tax=Fistulifera solaris TaxID=1519565 RepID=A0A1Z5K355_FISSO|nr:hypothetical protein FisN_32Hh073 [Fistulifera solaris]|eukprot:GAX20684.1 hypothetical protein FisN_32Hh073 [Fistulifera solaris]